LPVIEHGLRLFPGRPGRGGGENSPACARELNGEFRGAGLGATEPAGDVVPRIRRDGRLLNEFPGTASAAGEEIAAVSRPGFGGFSEIPVP